MNKEWVDEKINSKHKKILEMKDKIVEFVNDCPFYSVKQKENIFDTLNIAMTQGKTRTLYNVLSFSEDLVLNNMENPTSLFLEFKTKFNELYLEQFINYLQEEYYYLRLLDSQPLNFCGDIVITDPSYTMLEWSDEQYDEYERNYPKKENFIHHNNTEDYSDCTWDEIFGHKYCFSKTQRKEKAEYEKACSIYQDEHPSDWEKCNYGSNLEVFGIHTYMTRDTIWGDWSCTVYQTNKNNEEIGKFCADVGLVSVIDLKELLEYNPKFIDWAKEHKWCVTIIKNFKGTVSFSVKEELSNENENPEYCVEIIGNGVNTITGEPIEFIGKQTGL